jgi:DNA polymerase-3 subunit gamma/tau
MAYKVTALKWRPKLFRDIIGQSHVTETLQNALKTNRVSHAYVFSGPRGCGKTTTARILAKALNCLSPVGFDPDNSCDVCIEINDGRSLDVIEIDGASNRGVDEIRNLREAVRYTPTRGKFKIYIIDEVHMLTKEAFNALLKTLEEPPEHALFIFATTEVHKVPLTILSRCQRFDFRRISVTEIAQRLQHIAQQEGIIVDEESLMIIAKKGDGSLRDALSIFDQVHAFCGTTIASGEVLKALNAVDTELYFRVTDLIRTKDQRGALMLVEEITRQGYDLREFVSGLVEHFRNLLIVLGMHSTELVETSEPYRKRYQTEAGTFSENDLLRLIKLAGDLEQAIRWSPQPRYRLEVGILQMVNMESSIQIEELLSQIEELKRRLAGGAQTQPLRSPSSTSYRTDASPTTPSDVKVVGTVNAGRLKSASAVAVPSATYESRGSQVVSQTPTVPASFGNTSSVFAASTTPSLQPISAQNAYARWQQWVEEVRRARISVGTVLGESEILEVRNGTLRIGCPDDYHYSTLKRSKEFLIDSFERITGARMYIEPVICRKTATRVEQTSGSSVTLNSAPRAESATDADDDEHPVIAALKRELGAERIE